MLVLLVCIIALSIGRFHIPFPDVVRALLWFESTEQQVWNVIFLVRLPRVLATMLIGSSLALSGVVYQSLFRNPLVSQDILGVSAGATVGASLAIILGLSSTLMVFSAFGMGLLSVAITLFLARCLKSTSIITLVLAGMVVSGLFNSLTGLMRYLADTEAQLPAITFWTLGSIARVTRFELRLVSIPLVISTICVFLLRWRLNVLQIDDPNASSDNRLPKYLLIVFSTVLTACAVSISGTISWIGLVIPHIGRAIVGSDNKKLIPVSALLGCAFLVIIDTLARNLSGVEIPLSILTGTLGAPLFIWIIHKYRRWDS